MGDLVWSHFCWDHLRGNWWTGFFHASMLVPAIEERDLNWKFEDGKLKVKTLKPREVRREIVPNSTKRVFAQPFWGWTGRLWWEDDDWAEIREIHFGSHWPSKDEVSRAMTRFTLGGPLEVCAGPSAVLRMFPNFTPPLLSHVVESLR